MQRLILGLIDFNIIYMIFRNEVLEYSKHVMSLGGLLFELLTEALGLSSEILKSMGCMKGVRAYAQPLLLLVFTC